MYSIIYDEPTAIGADNAADRSTSHIYPPITLRYKNIQKVLR